MDDPFLIETEFVEILANLSFMHDPWNRVQFTRTVRRRLAAYVALTDFPEPRSQAVEIVQVCSRIPGGMVIVVDAVKLFSPADASLPRLQALLDVHNRGAAVSLSHLRDIDHRSDLSELRSALSSFRPPNPGRLYQRATEHVLPSPPEWCETAWDMFCDLGDQNALASGLPPSMVFLLLLEEQVDSRAAATIRRCNQRIAWSLGVTELLDHRRAVMNTPADRLREREVYLVIQVEPHQEPRTGPAASSSPPKRYNVLHYRQWHGGGAWNSQLQGRIRDVSRSSLQSVVEEVIWQMDRDWSDRSAETVVEFVLPVDLLNEDVAWWRKEPARTYLNDEVLPDKVLSMEFPVVVRSLERLREYGWHNAWRRRWARLQASPAHGRLYRRQPEGTGSTDFEVTLSADYGLAALVLSEPPLVRETATRTGARELWAALRAGMPVIVWHRERPTDDAFWRAVRNLITDGSITNLPSKLLDLRLAALQLPRDRQSEHIGRHVTVLWDDPDRMPELEYTEPATDDGE